MNVLYMCACRALSWPNHTGCGQNFVSFLPPKTFPLQFQFYCSQNADNKALQSLNHSFQVYVINSNAATFSNPRSLRGSSDLHNLCRRMARAPPGNSARHIIGGFYDLRNYTVHNVFAWQTSPSCWWGDFSPPKSYRTILSLFGHPNDVQCLSFRTDQVTFRHNKKDHPSATLLHSDGESLRPKWHR